MRYRRYHCRLDQLSDILGTGLFERISILRRSPEVSLTPDGVQVAEIGDRMKRWSIQQLKQRARCARCRKLGHWAREWPEGNRGQHYDEIYDRLAWRSEENSKGFIAVAGHTERRPFFLGALWTFVALDPGEVLWDTGAQEGIVGKQQLDKWCKLLAEHGLQVEWSQEKPECASGIGGATQPIGVENVPVGLVGRHGIIRFTVVASWNDEETPSWTDLERRWRQGDLPSIRRRILIAHSAKRTHGHPCRSI